MLVQLSDISVAHLGALEANLDEAMHFEPAVGGTLQFKLVNSDQVLGHVEVKPDDIEAEIMVPNEHKGEAYASVKQGVSSADESRVAQLAKRLPNMRRRALNERKWTHTTKMTNKNLAKVMVALWDAIEKWCFKTEGKADKMKSFKFLCDSCCDTHPLSLMFVHMMNLESKIDRLVRCNIGMANKGVAFKTEGTLDFELKIRDVEGVWHTLCLMWHVANIGAKCLLNTTALRKVGWRFVQQNNVDGTDGTCLIAPDSKIFALGGDNHEMPILPTRQAPMVAKVKPSTLRWLAQHLLHIAKYGNKPKPPKPIFRLCSMHTTH